MNKMTLYHGTSSNRLDAILRDGILPQKEDYGNWGNTVPSKNGLIYLSECYALHFAGAACNNWGGVPVVFMVDIPFERLYPDEDGLAQYYVMEHGGDLMEVTRNLNPLNLKYLTKQSLNLIGNCSCTNVWKTEIIAYVRFHEAGSLIRYTDASISILNYHVLGRYYRDMHRWLFDPTKSFPSRLAPFNMKSEYEDKFIREMNKRKDFDLVQLDKET